MDKPQVDIYTDGACANNPGAGGFGVVMFYKDANNQVHKKEFSCGYKMTTNNRMELLAVVFALENLKKPCKINLYSDSKYVVDAINKNWLEGWVARGWKSSSGKVKNIDLWQKYLSASKNHEITFIWVKGHASNEFNNRCDELAVLARNQSNLLDDDGFLN